MTEAGFEKVAALGDLAEGVPTAARLANGEWICMVRVANLVYAIDDRCTHAEFSMSDGEMVDDHAIECALHGARFDIRDGSVLSDPADTPIGTYEVRINDNQVWVRRKRSGPA